VLAWPVMTTAATNAEEPAGLIDRPERYAGPSAYACAGYVGPPGTPNLSVTMAEIIHQGAASASASDGPQSRELLP